MILVFGGSYQGKLDFVKENFLLKDEDIATCIEDIKLNLSTKCIYKLEDFVYACARENVEAKEVLMACKEELEDKILVMSDVSQGLVPMDPLDRAYREMAGRTLVYLGQKADKVIRIFCGLSQVVKE